MALELSRDADYAGTSVHQGSVASGTQVFLLDNVLDWNCFSLYNGDWLCPNLLGVSCRRGRRWEYKYFVDWYPCLVDYQCATDIFTSGRTLFDFPLFGQTRFAARRQWRWRLEPLQFPSLSKSVSRTLDGSMSLDVRMLIHLHLLSIWWTRFGRKSQSCCLYEQYLSASCHCTGGIFGNKGNTGCCSIGSNHWTLDATKATRTTKVESANSSDTI